jgi:predicted ArsR family transcriptional regulator
VDRLVVLKALADDSRYAIFAELGRADRALSTVELAQRLDLHPNTVRLHLERLRDAGLVHSSTGAHGAPGRPQHLWALTPDAPALGLEPDGFRVLAHLLADALAVVAPDPDALVTVGRRAGAGRAGAAGARGSRSARGSRRHPAAARPQAGTAEAVAAIEGIVAELADLGFDPAAERTQGGATAVAFASCPFRELATAYPDLVCTLHRGVTEGIVAAVGRRHPGVSASVTAFSTLVDADPCRAEVAVAVGDRQG